MGTKMKTSFKDKWGQEIHLGDAVIQIGIDGWYPETPYIVTREGAAENVQVNGGSYSKISSLIVVTQQYIHHKGQAAYDFLVSKYELNEKPVASKITTQYAVVHDDRVTKKFLDTPVIGNNSHEARENCFQ